jgi:NRPS condensation-like uncharacterized protein
MEAPTLGRLNELDTLFYVLECLGYPPLARIHFELRGGSVDTECLQQAYRFTVERFPVCNALLEDRSRGFQWNLCWVPRDRVAADDAIRLYDLSHLDPGEAEDVFDNILFDTCADYRSETSPPFFMALCKLSGGHSRLIFFFHHAVADAYGYSMVIKYLCDTYNTIVAHGAVPQPQPVLGGISPILPRTVSAKAAGFVGAIRMLADKFLKSSGKAPPQLIDGESTALGRTHAIQRGFSPQRLAQYAAAAKYFGVTLNEYLVTAQITAFDRLKAELGEPCDYVSVQVHKRLSREGPELAELANRFSIFPIMADRRSRNNVIGLLSDVRRQSLRAKENHIAEKNICLLWMLSLWPAKKYLPFWGPSVLQNPAFSESLAISNIGRLWVNAGGETVLTHFGDADISACYIAGPPFPGSPSYTGIWTYRERLYVSFNYFTRAIPREYAERFVDLTEGVLDAMAALAPQQDLPEIPHTGYASGPYIGEQGQAMGF